MAQISENQPSLEICKPALISIKSDFKMNESKSNQDICYEDYILNNIRNLFENEQVNDVTFIVEDEELYGNRALFAAQSDVFRNMLYGSMMESDPFNEVILNDITIPAFKYLRNTFYNIFNDKHSINSTLTAEIVVDVLFAAQKYLIPPLIHKCISFIKSIESIDDWYCVLLKFEKCQFPHQSKLYLQTIVNDEDSPWIFKYKSVKFLTNSKFNRLSCDTIIILINSDCLAAKEHEIWQALIKWTKFNSSSSNPSKLIATNHEEKESETNLISIHCDKDNKANNHDEKNQDNKEREEEEDVNISDIELDESEKELLSIFIKYIRFNQMDAKYFKEQIVDKNILPQQDIINIMFSRENGSIWKSSYNDKPRNKSKLSETFEILDFGLTFKQIQSLKVGDLIDFRDLYGLFCPATVIETDHSQNRIKIHYENWGSSYDEWFVYLAEGDNDRDNDDGEDAVILSQQDINGRVALYGSITGRNIKRECFKQQVERYADSKGVGGNDLVNEIQVKLPKWFWKKNESTIDNKQLFMDKWLNAKIVGYKTSTKYSHHIKIGVYINDEHFEYWIHPDNHQEVRPFAK